MSFKTGSPVIAGSNGSITGSNIMYVTINANNLEQTFAAGTFIERISVSDLANPVTPVTITSRDGLTIYSVLDISGGYGIDLIDLYFPVATTLKFNNLSATGIGSIRYYRHSFSAMDIPAFL